MQTRSQKAARRGLFFIQDSMYFARAYRYARSQKESFPGLMEKLSIAVFMTALLSLLKARATSALSKL